MKQNKNRDLWTGIGLLLTFLVWTLLIRRVDVRAAGPGGTAVGFGAFNTWFHRLTGVHMGLYTVTDWLGLVPIAICLCFAVFGCVQAVKRRSLCRVDPDIILLGVYYLLVIFGYLFFETVPINYRPILIDGVLEASYPSSTTLLVLSVMPTLRLQLHRRTDRAGLRTAADVFAVLFSAFMAAGRSIAGVHWATDIIGAVFLSRGLFRLYRHCVRRMDRRGERTHGIQ